MKDTKAILNRILEIRERFPNGLPETAINIGCDVKKLYPSIDSEMGMAAVKKWLQRFPNPDGLPLQLIMDLGQICVENTGVENTGWTLYRDDGWLVALNGMEDVPLVENILQNLHPNIKWEINPRGPSVPPGIGGDGQLVDRRVLEHLDLTIHIVDNHLETDLFAKDIPIYISRNSCHPPMVFPAVVKSVGLRLRTNCSLDRFLTPRIEEYSRYLLASNYTRQEIDEVMEGCKYLDRKEIIKRPRKDKRRGGPKKFVICSKWDPRQPNIHKGVKLLEEILYMNKENEECFPRGSIIAGFRRQKNIGEIIAGGNFIHVSKEAPL